MSHILLQRGRLGGDVAGLGEGRTLCKEARHVVKKLEV